MNYGYVFGLAVISLGIVYLISMIFNPIYPSFFIIMSILGMIRWRVHKIEQYLKDKDDEYELWN